MLKDTVSDLLGKKNDNELTKQIKSLIRSEEGVHGAYDLVINDYGPEKKLASVHVELPDTMTVADLDSLTRKIEKKVYRETGVMRFDVVIKFGVNAQEALETIKSEAAELYPDFTIQVSPDIDLG